MRIIILVFIIIIVIAVITGILRKRYTRRASSHLAGFDFTSLNISKEKAKNSFKSTRTAANKTISESMKVIFNKQSANEGAENSKELGKLSSKIDNLLK